MGVGHHAFHRLDVAPVGRIVEQASQMDAVMPRQSLHEVKAADFLALVGWVRDALGQKEDVGHERSRFLCRIGAVERFVRHGSRGSVAG